MTGATRDSGYAVALEGHSLIMAAEVFFSINPATGLFNGQEAMRTYIREHKEELSEPGMHIGGWYDTESQNIFLDLSQVFDNEAEAIQAGRDRDQIAIFDLNKGEEISTGGTGGLTIQEPVYA
jgi:hypothetical protein